MLAFGHLSGRNDTPNAHLGQENKFGVNLRNGQQAFFRQRIWSFAIANSGKCSLNVNERMQIAKFALQFWQSASLGFAEIRLPLHLRNAHRYRMSAIACELSNSRLSTSSRHAHKLQFCHIAAPKHRPVPLKQSDRMSVLTNRSFSFLGSTSDRNAAYPGIAELDFVVEQDRPCQHGNKPDLKRYTKSDLPPQIRCVNPRCQQGGLATQGIVLYRGAGVHELWCKGHEGSPSGRRKGDPCDNSFIVTLRIDRSGSQGDE